MYFKPLPVVERLHQAFNYNPQTGWFVWLIGQRKGYVAGSYNTDGYIIIQLDGMSYMAHRLAYKYVHGVDPINEIDHDNNQRDCNRLDNLVECTHH